MNFKQKAIVNEINRHQNELAKVINMPFSYAITIQIMIGHAIRIKEIARTDERVFNSYGKIDKRKQRRYETKSQPINTSEPQVSNDKNTQISTRRRMPNTNISIL